QVHIVYFGAHKGDKALHEIEDTHHSYLLSVKKNEEEARASLLYSYKHSINGFAAMLTQDEASKLSDLEEVVSVINSHNTKYTAHTTRSWEFMHVDETGVHNSDKKSISNNLMLENANYGNDVIVGLVDSGVWPESESFSDEGMGPISKYWKGICQTGPGFNSSHCNKKIIGARYYPKAFEKAIGPVNPSEDSRSPRDMDGHGTHCASVAVGRRVENAEGFAGYGHGTASGGAPLARLAIYKSCWATPNQSKAIGNTCFLADMLAAIDDAIADGVHVLSISIGAVDRTPYNQDFIAIGALHATRKNIVVASSAGNNGPARATTVNTAPWIMTVGAGSIDRMFWGHVSLGNGMLIKGQSVTPHKMDGAHPLVFAADVVGPDVRMNVADGCFNGSLDPEKVKGKVVLCIKKPGVIPVEAGLEVKRAGGVGMILGNSQSLGATIYCESHFLPATQLVYDDAQAVLDYIASSYSPTAIISPAETQLNFHPAPFVAEFSGRGPNVMDPNILKPDIMAPGLNILAAWSGGSTVSKSQYDNRVVKFNFDSGTSMACPHVAGVAALLRAIHPTWSAAAIRSAIMTTAWPFNNGKQQITDQAGNVASPLDYGSGLVHPQKAADPGLVYDISYREYLTYLCGIGIGNMDPTFTCPPPESFVALPLNYPSVAISKFEGLVRVPRTVTNVGENHSVYYFDYYLPSPLTVLASPSRLTFDRVGQEQPFTITIQGNGDIVRWSENDDYAFGWYSWSNGQHVVRSPISIYLA
ncbi:Peptidase_S8 domain-containing protein/PA domain-containing protein/Inhibitor_I9 domain-containing protein, partial [Cephalotus follicularis]